MSGTTKPSNPGFLGPMGDTDITLRVKGKAKDGSDLEFREDILEVNFKELTKGKEAHLRAGKIDLDK